MLIIAGLTSMQWVGLRIGSAITRFISVTIGLMMLILIAACFLAPAVPPGAPIADERRRAAAALDRDGGGGGDGVAGRAGHL